MELEERIKELQKEIEQLRDENAQAREEFRQATQAMQDLTENLFRNLPMIINVASSAEAMVVKNSIKASEMRCMNKLCK